MEQMTNANNNNKRKYFIKRYLDLLFLLTPQSCLKGKEMHVPYGKQYNKNMNDEILCSGRTFSYTESAAGIPRLQQHR